MYVMGIHGSPTRFGKVGALLAEALDAAAGEAKALGEGISMDTIWLQGLDMPFHNGSFMEIPNELKAVFSEMRRADAFIFATPVNWYNMSSLMKCFLDWMTSLENKFELEGKVAGVITHCNCDGGNQAAMALVGPLLHMGLTVAPYCAFYRNEHVAEKSEERWQMTDQRLVGQNVVRLAHLIPHNKRGWHLA